MILRKFGQICATGNAFVRLTVGKKMHLFLGNRSERGGARKAPTKRVLFIIKEFSMPRESGYPKGTEADTFLNLVQCLTRCAGSYARIKLQI